MYNLLYKIKILDQIQKWVWTLYLNMCNHMFNKLLLCMVNDLLLLCMYMSIYLPVSFSKITLQTILF